MRAERDGLAYECLVLADAEIGDDSVLDVPRLVDEKRGAAHAETQRSLHAVHLDHELVDVRQQREGQLVLLAESAVALRALRADAREPEAGRMDLVVQVADLAGLARAARGEVGGIEVEDQRAVAQQLAERDAWPSSSGKVNSGARAPMASMGLSRVASLSAAS